MASSDVPNTVFLPVGPFTTPTNPALPPEAFGAYGAGVPVPTDAGVINLDNNPSGASPRPDIQADNVGQMPQQGDAFFFQDAVAPDSTPPALYAPVVNQPVFKL